MAVETAVESRALSKSYGPLKALDEVSFEVRRGEIFGFIGADGAGKTTAFRIIGGVLAAGGGEIQVLGSSPRDARPRVGYLTQPFSLYMDLSVDENLTYAGGLREVPQADFSARRDRYFKHSACRPPERRHEAETRLNVCAHRGSGVAPSGRTDDRRGSGNAP